jgi:Cys-rich repeat protein
MQRSARVCAGLAIVALLVLVCGAGCEPEIFEEECGSDTDCPSGFKCIEFMGASCEPTCKVIACGRGQTCVESIFGAASCRSGCDSNDDCPAGSYCPSCWICWGARNCASGCHDDAECAAGEFCRDGSCLTQCSDNSECAAGTVCGADAVTLMALDAGSSCPPGVQCSCVDCASFSISVAGCAPADGGPRDATAD